MQLVGWQIRESDGIAKDRPLKILIYGLNYSPELTGIGKYTGEMAAWLAGRGHEVRVITAPPYYPGWSIWEQYRTKPYGVERSTESGQMLTVFRVPLYVPATPSGVKRMVHLASFMLGSLPVIARQFWWHPDVVWTVEPTFFSAPVALLVAAATGSSSWLHVQDFEVDAAFDLNLLPAHGPVHWIALRLEGIFTRAFDVVSTISTKMVERARTKGVPASRAVLFPNWVDVEAISPQPPGAANFFRRELGLEGKRLVVYSGNMGAKQGLELLAPLAKAFEEDTSVHFLFCGDGAFRPRLEGLVAESANVTLLGLQPPELLNDLLNAADIHLLPQRAGAADLVMPSKLTGMLSSGRPVVATADAGTQVATVVEQCGLAVATGDEVALEAALRRLLDEPALRAGLGVAARRYAVEHLGREQVLLEFERTLTALAHRTIPDSSAASRW